MIFLIYTFVLIFWGFRSYHIYLKRYHSLADEISLVACLVGVLIWILLFVSLLFNISYIQTLKAEIAMNKCLNNKANISTEGYTGRSYHDTASLIILYKETNAPLFGLLIKAFAKEPTLNENCELI